MQDAGLLADGSEETACEIVCNERDVCDCVQKVTVKLLQKRYWDKRPDGPAVSSWREKQRRRTLSVRHNKNDGVHAGGIWAEEGGAADICAAVRVH
jgi:hypothetical protein